MEPLQNIKLSFKCPKQLNKLQSLNGDWYCDSCQKIVHDFRGMNEHQILTAIRNNNDRTCGIFEAGRIEVLSQQNGWRRWASAAVMLLGITGLNQRLYAQVNKRLNTPSVQADTNAHPFLGTISAQDPDTIKLQPAAKPLPDNVLFGAAMETFPEFPGGDAALTKYLREHIRYSGKFMGKIFVQFAVETNGSISNVMILRGGDKQINNETMRVIKMMPKWKPGIQNGKPYRVLYTLPVTFGQTVN